MESFFPRCNKLQAFNRWQKAPAAPPHPRYTSVDPPKSQSHLQGVPAPPLDNPNDQCIFRFQTIYPLLLRTIKALQFLLLKLPFSLGSEESLGSQGTAPKQKGGFLQNTRPSELHLCFVC